MNDDLKFRLQNIAGKLRQLWGENSDSQTIDEAVALFDAPTPVETPAPAQTKKVTK